MKKLSEIQHIIEGIFDVHTNELVEVKHDTHIVSPPQVNCYMRPQS